MLRIVTGPFHPALEHTLVEDLRRLKQHDPFAPAAIIVPSSLMSLRVRELLVLESGLPILNVHFMTFHQLALRLLDEHRLEMAGSTSCPKPPTIVSDLFFEQLLRRIARSDLPGLESLGMADLGPGTWAALWATLRDLKDGGVDPKTALAAVADGQFDIDHAPGLAAVFVLFAAVLAASDILGIGTPEDLAAASAAWASQSPFLRGLQALYYYGFYDLTEPQLLLFKAVTAAAPVTLFFPLVEKPTFAFARRFFERHMLPLVRSSVQVTQAGPSPDLEARTVQAPAEVTVMSAVGTDDELIVVCKEILALVEARGYRFQDIGVVARSLQAYAASLSRIFADHRIPIMTTAVTAALRHPAAKMLLQLARLPLEGFHRNGMLDVLCSPYYRDARHLPGVDPSSKLPERRPDLWRLAVNLLGIRGGVDDWSRLARIAALAPTEDHEDGRLQDRIRRTIPAGQFHLLSDLVAQLMQDIEALPRQGTVIELTDAFAEFLSSHCIIPDHDAALSQIVDETLDHLKQLGPITGSLTWEEWTELLTRLLEQAAIPVHAPESDHGGVGRVGVQVLDVMGARGLPFRALFLLGLNEKVFPRFIQEDAFLRDRDRRVLETTLGYKVDEKLSGYDEEQLLFTLLCGAARHRLYFLYQRADFDGRPLAPSPYLADAPAALPVPRRHSDRRRLSQFAAALLTRDECILQMVLDRDDPVRVMDLLGRDSAIYRNGIEAVRSIESVGSPGVYDGVVGALEEHWGQVAERGIAPTALEDYARCPTRYFMRHVLKLESFREPPVEVLQPKALGTLAHSILRRCGERLVAMGWPMVPLDPAVVRLEASVTAADVFAAYAAEHDIGYPLLWEMARETLTASVLQILEEDQSAYDETGYHPVAFEVEVEGSFAGFSDSGTAKVRGRLDRVDQRDSPLSVRVVDYKFKPGRAMDSSDRDLTTAAIRGLRLQPPLYAMMNIHTASPKSSPPVFLEGAPAMRPEQVEFRFLAPRWKTPVARSIFDTAVWRGPVGERLTGTLKVLLDGLRGGHYGMVPGEYCDHCDVSTACRRLHGASWWRAQNSPSTKALRVLRRQKVDLDPPCKTSGPPR